MTEPLSSAEIAEAKALCERADADPRSNEARMYPGFASTVLPRAFATIEAKDAEIAAERTARQEAERMLARVEAVVFHDWLGKSHTPAPADYCAAGNAAVEHHQLRHNLHRP